MATDLRLALESVMSRKFAILSELIVGLEPKPRL